MSLASRHFISTNGVSSTVLCRYCQNQRMGERAARMTRFDENSGTPPTNYYSHYNTSKQNNNKYVPKLPFQSHAPSAGDATKLSRKL